MNVYETMLARLKKGEKILIDGGTGTEAERRGIPKLEDAWNGGGAVTHPDIIRTIHEDYIKAGAELIISNTFATSRHALRDAGVEDQFDALNRRGVELAIEARNNLFKPEIIVAGGVAYWSWSGKHPPLTELKESMIEQVTIMKEAGADMLIPEMMVDLDRMEVTLDACDVTGLPTWVGLSCRPNEAGTMCLLNGEPLTDALAILKDRGIPLLFIMHTRIDHIDASLDTVEQHWNGLTGVYAHTSREVEGKWIYDDAILPHDYAEHCKRWLKRDVHMIGGCCGMTPAHIRAVQRVM